MQRKVNIEQEGDITIFLNVSFSVPVLGSILDVSEDDINQRNWDNDSSEAVASEIVDDRLQEAVDGVDECIDDAITNGDIEEYITIGWTPTGSELYSGEAQINIVATVVIPQKITKAGSQITPDISKYFSKEIPFVSDDAEVTMTISDTTG